MQRHLTEKDIERRSRIVLLVLVAIFISSMTMLNLLGTSRFLDLSFNLFGLEIPMIVAVGVLPYPITFLCTDFISELYGKEKASEIVWVGLVVNAWLALILWIGGALPGFTAGELSENSNNAFMTIRKISLGTIAASMIAYFAAQTTDVQVFHFLKKKTKGSGLWIRNNGSTMVSQLIDSVCVISITYFLTHSIPLPEGKSELEGLIILIGYSYIFKLVFAALDTPIFYFGVKYLRVYLRRKDDSF
ncbi:MAG: queuosine precursor transporter [Thermodesulfobacteriota bacterium]|jgi:hypothetical protein|nr:MAG: VUT family protein [Candidatus Dadabacteria bacterium]